MSKGRGDKESLFRALERQTSGMPHIFGPRNRRNKTILGWEISVRASYVPVLFSQHPWDGFAFNLFHGWKAEDSSVPDSGCFHHRLGCLVDIHDPSGHLITALAVDVSIGPVVKVGLIQHVLATPGEISSFCPPFLLPFRCLKICRNALPAFEALLLVPCSAGYDLLGLENISGAHGAPAMIRVHPENVNVSILACEHFNPALTHLHRRRRWCGCWRDPPRLLSAPCVRGCKKIQLILVRWPEFSLGHGRHVKILCCYPFAWDKTSTTFNCLTTSEVSP